MTRLTAVTLAALVAAAPLPAVAQERELIQLGIGIIGHAIQQSQQPRQVQQPQRQPTPAPAPVAVAPRYADVPMPIPRPDDLGRETVAQADAIEAPAGASELDRVTIHHNGSIMEMRVADMLVTITYTRPRDGLAAAGVTPGTRLFQGAVVDGQLVGDAYAFKSGCEPAAYYVTGQVGDAGDFVLTGDGPVRNGCAVSHLDPDSPHARLGFSGERIELAALFEAAAVQAEQVPTVAVLPVIEEVPAPAPVVAPQPTPVAVTPQVEREATPVGEAPPAPRPEPVTVADPAPSLPTPPVPAVTPAPEPEPVPVPVIETPAPTPPALDIDF